MYFMYVDESGDTGLSASPTDFFVLSGIVVHESDWRSFIDGLLTFKKTMKSVYGLPVRAEIHASEFINKKAHGLERHIRLAILRNAIDELARTQKISITNVVIDKRSKPEGYDVFQAAWRTLFQRFENTMIGNNFPGGHMNSFGTVFTDATAGRKLTGIMRKMSVYNPVPNGFGLSPNTPIRRIIEDPHGKDSRTSLPIQMADVCAYFLQQRFKPNSFIKRKGAHSYFERLAPVLNLKASIRGDLGIVKL